MGETNEPRRPLDLSRVSQELAAINGGNNAIGVGNALTVTSASQGSDAKSMSYWGEVADEAEKVAARRSPKEINRVKFILREALNTIEAAEKSL
jgi:hypothetical protein